MLAGFVENRDNICLFFEKKIYIYYLAGYPVIQPVGYPVSGISQTSLNQSVYEDYSLGIIKYVFFPPKFF